MIQKPRFALNFFLCVWVFFCCFLFLLEREKAFKLQIKNKSFNCFFSSPSSKSYEGSFHKRLGGKVQSKMLYFFFFLIKRLFFWNVPFRCLFIEVSAGERVSMWLVQTFLFCRPEEKRGEELRVTYFSYCSPQIYCNQYCRPIVSKDFGLALETTS